MLANIRIRLQLQTHQLHVWECAYNYRWLFHVHKWSVTLWQIVLTTTNLFHTLNHAMFSVFHTKCPSEGQFPLCGCVCPAHCRASPQNSPVRQPEIHISHLPFSQEDCTLTKTLPFGVSLLASNIVFFPSTLQDIPCIAHLKGMKAFKWSKHSNEALCVVKPFKVKQCQQRDHF